MNHIEQLYLQIIHNTCTQTSSNITISQDVSISLINPVSYTHLYLQAVHLDTGSDPHPDF